LFVALAAQRIVDAASRKAHALHAAPEALCPDKRSRFLGLYLASPLNRTTTQCRQQQTQYLTFVS